MKRGLKILIGLGIFVIVVVAAFVFFVSNLDSIVKGAIERYGSRAAGTEVKVGSVNISLKKGEGSIGGFSIGNPSGFSGAHAFEMQNITIAIDTGSLTENPVVIRKILVSGPHITYEINKSGQANIDEIRKNLESLRKSGEPSDGKRPGEKRTFIIKDLVIERGRVDAGVAALPDKSFTTELPRIQLTNVGGQGGSTPSELAAQILRPVANRVISAVSDTGVRQYLGKSAEEVGKAVEESLKKKTGTAGGEAAGKAKKALENFTGK
ncbi:MAG: hypothetical protein P8Z30_19590 [Acidobacteriota bacterium]|jgi:uncharacterized protein involved in outer membrane biogenesis